MSELMERLAGRRVVASISGGKDSAALSLWLTEQGIEHDRVFMDTGWEHQLTYEYLRGTLVRTLGSITEIQSERGGMEAWIAHKGMFPSRRRRWCTEVLKVDPIKRHLRTIMDGGQDVVNCVGIRAAESKARSLMPEWEWSDAMDCEVWRPLLAWTDEDVIAIHKRHGLRPNPLYLLGAERVGCWPCIYARKSEIRLIADKDPERIAFLAQLEASVTEAQRHRKALNGGGLENAAGWFQAPLGGSGACWPISRVVEWSRTSHGGKQFELFAADAADAGCMRWGLCDTATQEPAPAKAP